MKAFITLSTFSVLLGACSSASGPAPGSAAFAAGTGDYTVTQNGATHTLSASALRAGISHNGVSLWQWASSGATPSGFARSTGDDASLAAGLDNGTYFAGISGTLSTRVAIGGSANYSGAYAFVVNGIDQHGPIALTANFDTGSIVDTTTGIEVLATITGANINGTVSLGGETGTLKGGFYGVGSDLAGAAIGANMAGIISVR